MLSTDPKPVLSDVDFEGEVIALTGSLQSRKSGAEILNRLLASDAPLSRRSESRDEHHDGIVSAAALPPG